VLAVVTDRKRGRASSGTNIQWFVADVLSAQQYYPFGMLMPGNASTTLRRQYSLNSYDYRYGFNGKEGDDEVKGDDNQVDFGARPYDPRSGRWLSVDPMAGKYPGWSPYNFVLGNPIQFIDPDGAFTMDPNDIEKYPMVAKFLESLSDKFIIDGKLEPKFYEIYTALSGMNESEIISMLTWGEGPIVQPYDLTGFFGDVYIGKEDGQRHGYINGRTPYQYTSINGEEKITHMNMIQIDEQIFGTLEVALGGGLDLKYSPGSTPDLDKIRNEWKSILVPLFESTVLHEGIHYGRFEKGLPSLLEETLPEIKLREPGKVYEVLYYGFDISKRIDNTQYSEPLPIKSIDHEKEN
jgi:RHS repeat-associated protein